ncbi:MAG: glycosyl hydrolase family 8 [Chitinophagales bacterium]
MPRNFTYLNYSIFLFLLFTLLFVPSNLNAQINTPSIAALPFGSNTTYPNGLMPTNLPTSGTYAQAQDAANAYNTWKSNYVQSCGGTPERFRVKFDNPSETVSEGIAYGMLLAAYAADKALFDGLWDYYKNFANGNGVMNWKINGCSGIIGSGGATDAELDAAMALLVANHQWPNSITPHDYESDATDLINAIKDHEIQPTTATGPYQTNNGDNWGFGNSCRNPSYQSPAFYKAFGEFLPTQSTFWDNCEQASYTLLNANAHPTTGLVSNWCDPNGTPNSCNGANEYGWDACRNPWRMGTDVIWHNDSDAAALCNKMAAWMQGVGASNLRGPLPQNGTGGAYHSPAFVSTWAVALMGANNSYQSLLNSVYTETVATQDSPPYYFGNTLRVISLFALTGNFWNPFNVAPPGPQAPFVTINSPADGITLQLGNDVDITATASDNDGTITNVIISIDNTPISSSNTSGNIYSATWTPTAIGTYTISVSATDNENMTTEATSTVTISNDPPPTADYNYGEVLQKSLFFYEAQQSGTLPEENRVHWRGDSGLEDGSDVGLDLTGGWYDAGDHVKFGFPMAFSATMLAWSGIEDQTAYESIEQWEILQDNLRHVCDYFLKCHIRNTDGSTNKFYGQVGNGGADHAWWGPAEVMQMNRPAYFVDATHPGSDLTGETAAALAAASMIFADNDPTYSALLLDNAIALYNFADTYKGKYSDAITDAASFYNSWSGYQDELVWGAIWLYRATNQVTWLTKAQTEYQNLSTEQGTNIPSYHWTLAWDDKAYGCYALMAQLTGQQSYKDDTERWLDYWTTGYNGQQISYSPGGQAHLDTWGSLRYAANTAFVALQYSELIANTNPSKSQTYFDFGVNQINYTLGSNPNNRSYVCGFGNNPPINPHHRTAHGSWANNINTPTNNRHILYGALVGGPSSANDQYTDSRTDYIANEVACDYNAGFTGALANLLGKLGGTALADFPQPETYDFCDEYFNESKINASSNTFTEVAVWATNHSAWHATETDQVCYRYFVDISEGIANGYAANDYTTTINTAPNGTTVSDLILWDGTVYYVEVCFNNVSIYPGGQSESHKEAQLRIALPNNAPSAAWDATNDWSYYIAENTPMNNSLQTNPRIPFYNDGQLLCGELPSGGNQNTPPIAVIAANPISGNAPLVVAFNASGSSDANGDVLTYSWDFGDGNTSTDAITNHTFNNSGVYTVMLTVNDGNGGTDTETVNITAIDATPQPPTANFTANPTSGGVPLNVAFNASASTDPNGDALAYTWDFGDGNSATGVSTNHIYTAIGTYTAILTVNDGNGGTDSETAIINVTNTAPTASFTATPSSGQPPLAVSFDASASIDANGDNLTYNWDFGDGTSSTGVTSNHTYNSEGNYTVTLTVNDGNGGIDTATTGINVSLITCNLSLKYKTPDTNSGAAADNQIRAHFLVENLGSDPISLQEITIRYWYTKEGTQNQNVWIDYAQIGSSKITTNFVEMATPATGADHYLEVGFTSNAGSISAGGNSGEVQTRFAKTNWSNYDETDDYSYNMNHSSFQTWDKVTVYCNGVLAWGTEPNGSTGGGGNNAPVAAATATPTSGFAPLTVAFDGSGSSDADGDALTYSWNFGDGNSGIGSNPSHTFTNVGTYTVTLTVNDGNGGTDSTTLTIVVNSSTPTACFSATPTSGTAPLVVNFNANCSISPTGASLTYSWNFGDGNLGTGSNPSHTFNNVGTYTVTLTVNDGNGGTDSTTLTIVVNSSTPTACFSATSTSGTAPLVVNFNANCSSSPTGASLTYNWDFGDGNSGNGSNPSHTFNNVGTYTVTLTVNDGNGGSDTESKVITVNEPTTGGGDVEVIFTVDNVWNTGYCATVKIINNTNANINGWTLNFNLNANINNLWNANWSNSGNNYTASNLSWNANIPAGGNKTFGFCASYSGSVTAPTNGVFNGSPIIITYVNNAGGNIALPINADVSAILQNDLVIQPNFTNSSATLKYHLSDASSVRILLFDQTGKMVQTLVDKSYKGGLNSLELSTNDLVAGNYFVQMVAEGVTVVKQLVVVK